MVRILQGESIKTLVEEEHLYMPVFLHQFVKHRYKLDDAATKHYLQNPTLIHDAELAAIVPPFVLRAMYR